MGLIRDIADALPREEDNVNYPGGLTIKPPPPSKVSAIDVIGKAINEAINGPPPTPEYHPPQTTTAPATPTAPAAPASVASPATPARQPTRRTASATGGPTAADAPRLTEVYRGLEREGGPAVPGGVKSPIQQTQEGNWIDTRTGRVAGTPYQLKPEALISKLMFEAQQRDDFNLSNLRQMLEGLSPSQTTVTEGGKRRTTTTGLSPDVIAQALGNMPRTTPGLVQSLYQAISQNNVGMGRNVVADRASQRQLEGTRVAAASGNARARMDSDTRRYIADMAATTPKVGEAKIGTISNPIYDKEGFQVGEQKIPAAFQGGQWYPYNEAGAAGTPSPAPSGGASGTRARIAAELKNLLGSDSSPKTRKEADTWLRQNGYEGGLKDFGY